MGRLHQEEREYSREGLADLMRNPPATRPLGAPSRLGFQRALRRSVAAAGKNAMLVARRRLRGRECREDFAD
eukprot:7557595-Pyramimonas_sp.AAC.1